VAQVAVFGVNDLVGEAITTTVVAEKRQGDPGDLMQFLQIGWWL
jgi:hypothetical protein